MKSCARFSKDCGTLKFTISVSNKTARISGQNPELSDCRLISLEKLLVKKYWKTINFRQYLKSCVKMLVGNVN